MRVSPTIEQRLENEQRRVKRVTGLLGKMTAERDELREHHRRVLDEIRERVEGLSWEKEARPAKIRQGKVLAIIDEYREGGE